MIKIVCIVPDKYKNEKWPKSVAALPRPGTDYMESREGTVLKILFVTHSENKINKPYLKVGLGE